MSGRARARLGATTVEALVSLLLTLLLTQLSWSLLLAAKRTTSRMIERSEALEIERLSGHVLAQELSAGVPGRDWSVQSSRILPLRAFRGLGELCAVGRTDHGGLVRYGGIRLPEPEKDSVLLLTATGEWRAARLVSRAASLSSCPTWPAASLERWSWEPSVPGVLLARVFERGSYHLEDRALRYRLGEGGRQPLTVERLERRSAFSPFPSGVELRLEVRVAPDVVWETERRLGGADLGGD